MSLNVYIKSGSAGWWFKKWIERFTFMAHLKNAMDSKTINPVFKDQDTILMIIAI